jgi:hypothetical protein
MRRLGSRAWLVGLASLAAGLSLAPVAIAHVVKASGPYRIELGWGNEPALAGSDNFVQADVADRAGEPVAVPAGALSVVVSYGSQATTEPLDPTEERGELRAQLVPTLPGSYAFEVTGTIAGHTVDVRAACGEGTFDCVENGASADFPVESPSPAELGRRLEREAARADDARQEADHAKTIAIVALALAALFLAASVGLAWRRRRSSPS